MKKLYRILSYVSLFFASFLLFQGSWTGFFIATAFCLIFATNEKISK